MLTLTGTQLPFSSLVRRSTSLQTRSTSPSSQVWYANNPNSSPPMRKTVSVRRHIFRRLNYYICQLHLPIIYAKPKTVIKITCLTRLYRQIQITVMTIIKIKNANNVNIRLHYNHENNVQYYRSALFMFKIKQDNWRMITKTSYSVVYNII